MSKKNLLYLNCIFHIWMVAAKFLKQVIRLIFISPINNIIHEPFVKFSFGWIDNFTSCFGQIYISENIPERDPPIAQPSVCLKDRK